MVNQQLLDYIKQQLQLGINQEQIKSSLLVNGWSVQDIDIAFSSIRDSVENVQSVPSMQKIASLPGAREIFGQAWVVYKHRFGTFLGVMIIPVLIMVALIAVLTGGGVLSLRLSLFSKFSGGGFGLFILLAFLFAITVSITQIWGQTALLCAIKNSQENIGIIESYRRGWSKIFSYYLVSFLTGLIIFAGCVFLIVPAIIFSVWFSLAVFVLIAEDLKGISALLKSREYVKGYWGAVLWRLFFIGLVSLIVSLVPAIIFWFVKIPYALEISRFILGLFITPLAMTYLFFVYSNLKALKGETVTPTRAARTVFILAAILGILAIPATLFLAVFLSVGTVKKRGRDARREADIHQIQARIEMYYNEHNNYPSSLDELSPKYFPSLPLDPTTNQSYVYLLQQGGVNYKICAQLEASRSQKCISSSR